jgi:hypothetical protein
MIEMASRSNQDFLEKVYNFLGKVPRYKINSGQAHNPSLLTMNNASAHDIPEYKGPSTPAPIWGAHEAKIAEDAEPSSPPTWGEYEYQQQLNTPASPIQFYIPPMSPQSQLNQELYEDIYGLTSDYAMPCTMCGILCDGIVCADCQAEQSNIFEEAREAERFKFLEEQASIEYEQAQCDVIGCQNMTRRGEVISVCEKCKPGLTEDQIHELKDVEHARTNYHMQTQAMGELVDAQIMEAYHFDADLDDE